MLPRAMQLKVGKLTGTSKDLLLDVGRLLGGRLLVQSSSGGGKSWCIRLLIEELRADGRMVIVLDPEGEFPSLREQHEFVIAGHDADADVKTDPATAKVLARKLLETGASAVLNLYDLSPTDRRLYVKEFLTALIDAPKTLWREVFVVLDEAHLFAPESGHGQAQSLEAVTSMATRGRKRGQCLIVATQRLSKLHKDVAAECNNVLIGPTTLDVDRDRALDCLGVARAERQDISLELKRLDPGHFFAVGRGFSLEDESNLPHDRLLVRVGAVKTTHPEPGGKYMLPPRAPGSMAEVLRALGDLPSAAAEETEEVEVLRQRVRSVQDLLAIQEEELRALRSPAVTITSEMRSMQAQLADRLLKVEETLASNGNLANTLGTSFQALGGALKTSIDSVATLWKETRALRKLADRLASTPPDPSAIGYTNGKTEVHKLQSSSLYGKTSKTNVKLIIDNPPGKVVHGEYVVPYPPSLTGADQLPATALRMLQVMSARRDDHLTIPQIATLTGVRHDNGRFSSYVRTLVQRGLAKKDGPHFLITAAGLTAAGPVDQPQTPRELLAMWSAKLDRRAAEMLEIYATSGKPLPVADVARRMGVRHDNGRFSGYVRALRKNLLVKKTRGGLVIAPELAL